MVKNWQYNGIIDRESDDFQSGLGGQISCPSAARAKFLLRNVNKLVVQDFSPAFVGQD